MADSKLTNSTFQTTSSHLTSNSPGSTLPSSSSPHSTLLVRQPLNLPHDASPNPRQQRLVWLCFGMATLTLFLMALGSATRVMNAGLSCPDWPLCYGTLIPAAQMNLQVFLEWFHRLVASSLGLLTLLLNALSWRWRQSLPKWLPALTLLSLCLVIIQGILGGLTVTQLLRFDIVSAHLGTGLLFFVTLLTMGLLLMPYHGSGKIGRLQWVGLGAAGLVYGQSILGALVASQWAVHQCLGAAQLCSVLHNHLWGVVPASLGVLVLAILVWRQSNLHPLLPRTSLAAVLILGFQVLLGVSTLRLKLQIPAVTIAHQAMGALLLGCLVAFSVLALRERSQIAATEAVPTNPISPSPQGALMR
jgi:heme a synthase